jgi:hypothetical protein
VKYVVALWSGRFDHYSTWCKQKWFGLNYVRWLAAASRESRVDRGRGQPRCVKVYHPCCSLTLTMSRGPCCYGLRSSASLWTKARMNSTVSCYSTVYSAFTTMFDLDCLFSIRRFSSQGMVLFINALCTARHWISVRCYGTSMLAFMIIVGLK